MCDNDPGFFAANEKPEQSVNLKKKKSSFQSQAFAEFRSCALRVDLGWTRWTRPGRGPQSFTSSRDLGTQSWWAQYRPPQKHGTWADETRHWTPCCGRLPSPGTGRTVTRNVTARGWTRHFSETQPQRWGQRLRLCSLWSWSPKPEPHPVGWRQTCQSLSPLELPLPLAQMPQPLADLTPNHRL